MRMCFDKMAATGWLKDNNTPAVVSDVLGWTRALKTHKFLASLHFWMDVLDVEAWSTKAMQADSGGSSLSLLRMLRALPERLGRLRESQHCKALTLYQAAIVRGQDNADGNGSALPTYKITSYKTEFLQPSPFSAAGGGDRAPIKKRATTTVLLHDYVPSERAFRLQRLSLVDNLTQLVAAEMAPTPLQEAFNRVYNTREFSWKALSASTDYFVAALELIFSTFKARFPAWVAAEVPLQAKRLRLVILDKVQLATKLSWRDQANILTVVEFWELVDARADAQVNLSLVLFFFKVCQVRDGSAANVEQFISKLNRVYDDPQRRQLGSDFGEDTLRCTQNGPPTAEFSGDGAVAAWTECFGMKLVKSVAAKATTSEKNAKQNAKRKVQYKQDEAYRDAKRQDSRDKHQNDKMTRDIGRGMSSPGVRQSLTKLRSELRSSTTEMDGVDASDVSSAMTSEAAMTSNLELAASELTTGELTDEPSEVERERRLASILEVMCTLGQDDPDLVGLLNRLTGLLDRKVAPGEKQNKRNKQIELGPNERIRARFTLGRVTGDGACFYACISLLMFGTVDRWNEVLDKLIGAMVDSKSAFERNLAGLGIFFDREELLALQLIPYLAAAGTPEDSVAFGIMCRDDKAFWIATVKGRYSTPKRGTGFYADAVILSFFPAAFPGATIAVHTNAAEVPFVIGPKIEEAGTVYHVFNSANEAGRLIHYDVLRDVDEEAEVKEEDLVEEESLVLEVLEEEVFEEVVEEKMVEAASEERVAPSVGVGQSATDPSNVLPAGSLRRGRGVGSIFRSDGTQRYG
jgi:hypothetical protein